MVSRLAWVISPELLPFITFLCGGVGLTAFVMLSHLDVVKDSGLNMAIALSIVFIAGGLLGTLVPFVVYGAWWLARELLVFTNVIDRPHKGL